MMILEIIGFSGEVLKQMEKYEKDPDDLKDTDLRVIVTKMKYINDNLLSKEVLDGYDLLKEKFDEKGLELIPMFV